MGQLDSICTAPPLCASISRASLVQMPTSSSIDTPGTPRDRFGTFHVIL
jgi:hypothetical protein